MTSKTSDTTATGKVQFVQSHQTPLNAGKYQINISQSVQIKGTNAETFSATREIVVSGDAFELNPQEIHAVFPPAGSLGDHSHVLPYIALRRSTLPWERLVQEGQENAPWLALLVFGEEEKQGETPPLLPPQILELTQLQQVIAGKEITVGDVKNQAVGQILPAEILNQKNSQILGKVYFPGLNLSAEDFPILTGHEVSDQVTVIDVHKELLEAILPTIKDLEYLAHIRQLKDDDDNLASEQLAVIMANRLPKQGAMSTAYLVSLEERYQNGTFDYQGATNQDYIRLITLKNWSFTCSDPEQSFMGLLKRLNQDLENYNHQSTLRLPKKDHNEAEKYLAQGNVPLPHYLRQGGKTFSWYHSPLIPGENKTSLELAQLDLRSGDQLIHYNANNGLFDISYASAWQLGQLLALQDTKLAVSLFNWKRTNAQKLAKDNQQALFPHLFAQEEMSNPLETFEFPEEIQTWFKRLGLLYGVPFNYLVPSEQMLPIESIRFFWLDWFWVECLLDGAFSIGRVRESDRQQDMANRPLEVKQITGFLMRSEVVAGWPDLQVDASDSNIAGDGFIPAVSKLPLLRCDRLSENVLICLFEGEIQTVDISLKPEGLHFGFNHDENDNLWRELRDRNGLEQSEWKVEPIPRKDAEKQVINIESLADKINTELANQGITFNPFTSAQFALQMIQGAQKVRFNKSTTR